MGAGGISLARLAIGAGMAFLLGHLLGPTEYGSYAFFVANIALLSPLCTLGYDVLAARELSAAKAVGDGNLAARFGRHAPLAVWRTAAVVSSGFVLVSLAHNFYRGTGFEITIVLEAVAIALTAQLRLSQGALRGVGKVSLGQFFLLIMPPLTNLLLFVAMLAFLRPSADLAISTFVAGTAVAFPLAMLAVRREIGGDATDRTSKAQRRIWRRASIYLGVTQIVYVASEQMPVVITGYLTNPTEVGLLDMARRFATFASIGLTVINVPLGPLLSELHRTGKMKQFQALAVRSTLFGVLVSTGLTMLYAIFGVQILHMIDSAFTDSYIALIVLCFGYIVNTMTGPVQLALTMSGHERDSLKGVASALICNFVLTASLTPFIGHLGGAIAGAAGQMVWNVTLSFLLWKRLGIRTDVFALLARPNGKRAKE
jgi:O-antigen/teichoic acid export membrane protein